MVTLNIHTNDGPLEIESWDIGVIEIEGKTFLLHGRFLYDQGFFDTFGLRTVSSLFKWFDKHRGTIRTQLGSNFSDVCFSLSNYVFENVSALNLENERFTYDNLWRTRLYGFLGKLTRVRSKCTTEGYVSGREGYFKLVDVDSRTTTRLIYTRFNFSTIEYRKIVAAPTSVNENWCRLLNYSFKMDNERYNFFRRMPKDSSDTPMLGIELEISSCLSPSEIQYIVTEVEPKQEPFFIFKQDSSVSGQFSPMELVTIPATPNYQKQAWRLFFSKVEMLCAAKGKQVSEFFDLSRMLSNGLHIHISKDKFFETGKHTNRFLALLNQEGSTAIDFIQPFTGRPSRYSDHAYCKIASSYYDGMTTARRIKVSSVDNRATAHSSNPRTIEVRMFQGIFDINHIIRCIEFTMAVFYYSAEAPYSALFGRRFKDGFQKFVLGQPGYKSIKKEFKTCV